MSEAEVTQQEISAAKVPHDIFLSNLIMNHILLFTAIAAFGGKYINLLVLVPIFSFIALAYTFYRAHKVKREDSEFIYVHWQIARRWSVLFSGVLALLCTVSFLGWWGQNSGLMMKELTYALIGGLGLLPTLMSVLVLVIIESDSLHHARLGAYPKGARQRYLNEED
ncbi:MAG: hypothetical protein COA63_000265 [Methylophaga sp.]|nr:hypothetical protein [Methylophaga sp.]